jgi:Domain of Unknown Function (DUF1206)
VIGAGRVEHGMAQPLVHLRKLVREGRSDAPGRVVDVLGRIGLAGYGIVHVLVAWLALQVAFGVPDAPADADGAVGTIARTPVGVLALVLAAIGLVAFALWQVTAAGIGFRWVEGGERARKRVGAVAKSVAMAALAVVVVNYLSGVGTGGEATAQSVAAGVLELPAGRLLLGLAAVVILVLAGAMTYTGVRRTFMGDLDVRDVAPAARRAIELTGAVGHLARALALAVVGVLAGTAALFADPARAGGLDAALRALGATPLGTGLLVVVAVGFAAFGIFCFADAATRRA